MFHGKPCWFELATLRGGLADAEAFYNRLLGWTCKDAGVPGFDYHLASQGGDMVAGLMETPEDRSGVPPHWAVYFDVDEIDAAVAKVETLGGKVLMGPQPIPGTGRFAIVADPQGAVCGLLEPGPMDPRPPVEAGAWNQQKDGHGNWLELMSPDPGAGFEFYSELFGWTRGDALDMGEMGTYQLFRWRGAEIGGMMGQGNAPVPTWLPYFGVNGVAEAIQRIHDGGGTVLHGPTEVPGGAFVAVARDPQGAHFALVGPKEHAPS